MYLCPQPKTLELKKGMLTFQPGSIPEIKKVKTSRIAHTEAYRLTVSAEGVLMEASSDAGFYYAELTLRQVMLNYRGCIPFLYIYDEPVFPYRGFMIDSCRHFFSVEEIKKMIDGAALFKFNKFHFHLSDDQGYRVESERYPVLNTVSSVRKGSHFGRGENDDTPYGYFYTKAELREIVRYCDERHIEVIPEFDVPGHTSALLSAFPELSCKGEPVEAKTTAGIFKDVLCAGNPDTMKLVKDIIDELCEIFPGKYFHIGGDEVPKANWSSCEKCRARAEELQGHFANELAYYLKKKGKKAICWNETLRGKNADNDNLTVALWMDKTGNSVEWANKGNPLIVECFTPYYLDYPYGMHPLKSVFSFNPTGLRGLTDLGKASVIGVESPVWTEYIRTLDKMSYMCFPRLMAVAHTGWNGSDSLKYTQFRKDAKFYCDILKGMGLEPAPEKDWDSLPAKRLSQVADFFANTLTPDFVKQLLHIEN